MQAGGFGHNLSRVVKESGVARGIVMGDFAKALQIVASFVPHVCRRGKYGGAGDA